MSQPEASIQHSVIRALAEHIQRCSVIPTDLSAVAILIEATARLHNRASEMLREEATRLANQSRQG